MFQNALEKKAIKNKLLKKWEVALQKGSPIKKESDAVTTAILLENYLNELYSDKRLITEDAITSSAISGVNFAILGLIRRAVPEILDLDLFGFQALPTPESPIFTLLFRYGSTKGNTPKGKAFWGNYDGTLIGEDPYYSLNKVVGDEASVSNGTAVVTFSWRKKNAEFANGNIDYNDIVPFYIQNSILIHAFNNNDELLTTIALVNPYYQNGTFFINSTQQSLNTLNQNGYIQEVFKAVVNNQQVNVFSNYNNHTFRLNNNGDVEFQFDFGNNTYQVAKVRIDYEFRAEGLENIPEIMFDITPKKIRLQKRILRGRFTLDAMYDLKKYHSIDLESELMEIMKTEIVNGIIREALQDIRSMVPPVLIKTLDFTGQNPFTQYNVQGNYEDIYRLIVDNISLLSNAIWNYGRLGYGNWIIANPMTLSFLDRFPGFMGAGITGDSKSIQYVGSLAGKIRVYKDPQFPKGEILIGFKGSSQLETGYVHASYLPITTTPTLANQLSGDPIKIFYTRYGKTFEAWHPEMRQANVNLIERGEYNYARLILKGLPFLV